MSICHGGPRSKSIRWSHFDHQVTSFNAFNKIGSDMIIIITPL